jgi:hypothetical protein
MAGGSCHSRKRSWRAPLGFCPLQRTKLRKSTDPGFPSPGLFPSRRFSRPQGLTPSEAARACSIPLPLMGFRLQSLPVGGDALAGKPVNLRVPPKAATTRRKRPRSAPHVGWTPRRMPALRAVRTSGATARLQPRCPLAGGQTHRRDKALMAARTSSEPASLQPRPASRTFLPDRPGVRPKAGSDRAGREPTEGPHVPRDVGLRRLRASTKHVLPERWHTARGVEPDGASPDLSSTLRRATFCEPEGPRPATTTSGEHTTRLLRRSGTSSRHPQGEGASPFRSGRCPVRRWQAQGPLAPEAGPGRRHPSARGAWRAALDHSCREQAPDAAGVVPPEPHEPKPGWPGDQAAHGRGGSCLQDPRQASSARRRKQAPAALPSRPARRDRTQGPTLPECGPCGTEPVPSAQSDQPSASGCEGEPPRPSAQAAELGHHEGDLPRKRSAVTGYASHAPVAAKANLRCGWRDPPSGQPRGLPCSKALCRWLGAAARAVGRGSKLLRPVARTARASRPRGPLGSKAPCRAECASQLLWRQR